MPDTEIKATAYLTGEGEIVLPDGAASFVAPDFSRRELIFATDTLVLSSLDSNDTPEILSAALFDLLQRCQGFCSQYELINQDDRLTVRLIPGA